MGTIVFVPLSGLASVNQNNNNAGNNNQNNVFVPLSGLASVNFEGSKEYKLLIESFRPLIGVSFCKQVTGKLNKCLKTWFSSPYRG